MATDAVWEDLPRTGRNLGLGAPSPKRSAGAAPTLRAIFDQHGEGFVELWPKKELFPPGACAESMACTIAAFHGPQLALYDLEGNLWSICRPLWNGGLPYFLNRIREQAATGPDGRPSFMCLLITSGHWGAEGGVFVEMLLVQDICRILGAAADLHFRSVLMDGGQYVWRQLPEGDIAAILAEPRMALWDRLQAVRTDRTPAPEAGEEAAGGEESKESDGEPS